MSDAPKKKKKLKVSVIGDSGVGKTCIIRRMLGKDIFPISRSVGLSVSHVQMKNEGINFALWDSVGRQKGNSRIAGTARMLVKNALAVIIVYDVSKLETFQTAPMWAKLIKKGLKVILVGNKSESPSRDVSTEEGQELADQHGWDFFETSAHMNTGIDKMYKKLEDIVYEQITGEKREETKIEEKEEKIVPKIQDKKEEDKEELPSKEKNNDKKKKKKSKHKDSIGDHIVTLCTYGMGLTTIAWSLGKIYTSFVKDM